MMHIIALCHRNRTFDHIEVFLHMFDITHLLIVAFFFGCFGMELILREKCIDELPVGAIRHIDPTDSTYFLEIILRIVKLFFRPDIIEVGILDDLFEVSLGLREEYGRHDDPFDFTDSPFWMSFFFEPFTRDTSTEIFIFLVLYGESSIMEECCDLEIFEVFSLDSLRHREIRSTREHAFGMMRIVIGVVCTFCEEFIRACFCFFDKRHKKIG